LNIAKGIALELLLDACYLLRILLEHGVAQLLFQTLIDHISFNNHVIFREKVITSTFRLVSNALF